MRYNAKLDGLRCFAILGVLPTHFLPHSFFVNKFIDTGELGVRLFFVLSGYLIASILLKNSEQIAQGKTTIRHTLFVFYVRRFLRLSPVYYAYLILALFLIPGIKPYIFWYFTYLQNFLFTAKPELFGKYLPHFWTLAVEERFYLIIPFFLLILPRYKLNIAIALVIAGLLFRLSGILSGFSPFPLVMMMLGQIDVLGFGVLLAVLRSNRQDQWIELLVKTGLVIGLPLTIAFSLAHGLGVTNPVIFILKNTAHGLLFVAIVALASSSVPPKCFKFLEASVLVFVGRISYGIYVYHFNVPGLLRDVLLPRLGWTLPSSDLVRFSLYTFVTIGIATVSYYAYEQWFIRLKQFTTNSKEVSADVSRT